MKKFHVLSLLGLAAALSACDPHNCKSGDDDCNCTGQVFDCEWHCSGGGCSFEALDQSTSTFTCDGGDCSLLADGQVTVDFSCDGGGCSVTARDQAEVRFHCTGGGCTADVYGEATVTVTDCDDCSCNEHDFTASCEGASGSHDEPLDTGDWDW